MHGQPTKLSDLPPELLFDILVHSLSSELPLTNKHLFYTFKHASPSTRARYILQRYNNSLSKPDSSISLPSALRVALSYPICTIPTLDVLERIIDYSDADRHRIHVTPGRWTFRSLQTNTKPRRRKPGPLSTLQFQTASVQPDPLPFLEQLKTRYTLLFPERLAAFALCMCVRAGPAQYPLMRFLLQSGADPGALNCIALQVAATIGNIDTMRTLVEPLEESTGKDKAGKRRRVNDRVEPTPKVLAAAVKGKHTELAHWLIHEKGVVPDMSTMQLLQHM